MVTAYASIQDHQSSFDLFRFMLRKGHPKPNHFLFPHVLKYCQVTKFVHAQIEKLGFGQHPVVQTALIDSYSRLGEIENAISLFDEMPERDVPSWNAVISGCAQNGLFTRAITIFKKVQHRDIRPNQTTVVCALSACGHTGMLHVGKWIHGYVYRNMRSSDSFVLNALVDMYGKCGCLKEAKKVFDATSKKSLTSWNSMINCLALHGQSERAICVFEEMLHYVADVRPNEITFLGLLNACTHGGLVEKGRFYFQMMTLNYGIEPEIEHYGCLIDILGRAGRLEEALEVLGEMKIQPDEVVWGSLLNGCKIHGRADLAEFAVKKLLEIDPNNGGYGITLANVYGKLGKWDDVRRVRKMLKELNVPKTPGCSWIEVDNKVSQFHSVDKSHPRAEEIYQILENLVYFN
ncbi:pentatricopeptide repeat-containing protein [Populus alba x Populus x berolinensis]|uniref:Pentatricopeptide repeat-containing protein n=1 Tax=Populus alba x Populus x berolinensis TaxID=444605 RepID=A0AAD6LY97_9ROSI|nr:pentatricopeptide repeat-containing protein [Populus alba x Populus x berolinensis]